MLRCSGWAQRDDHGAELNGAGKDGPDEGARCGRRAHTWIEASLRIVFPICICHTSQHLSHFPASVTLPICDSSHFWPTTRMCRLDSTRAGRTLPTRPSRRMAVVLLAVVMALLLLRVLFQLVLFQLMVILALGLVMAARATRASSTRLTIGTPSSSKAPRPSPTRFGRTSASTPLTM